MCGIAGFVGQGDRATLERMTEILRHRGPDDGDTWYAQAVGATPTVALGHRRLSIIDLSAAGRQPMATSDGRYRIIYNGEVYNFAELRAQLVQAGCRFRSLTDTEVVLYGYAVWGPEVLDRLNGMFAFAIWDAQRGELFMARDRLGIKPVYYTWCGDTFLFASEIKSLLQYPGVTRRMNLESLHQYLSFLWVPEPNTMFDGVFKLPPGHWARLRRAAVHASCSVAFTSSRGLPPRERRLEIHQWWDCAKIDSSRATANPKREQELAEDVRDRLCTSVRRRLVADVSLGAFLSGGIDSSAVVAFMKSDQARPSTYTVGFTPEDLSYEIVDDDVRYARMLANLLDIDYHEIILRPQVIEVLPKVVWHMDDPVADPAAISTFLICQAARRKLTVMLNGQGGDEIFGGYPRHLAVKYAEIYNYLPRGVREHIIPRILGPLHAAQAGRRSTLIRNLKKFTRSSALPFHERYLGYLTHFHADEKLDIYNDDLRQTLKFVDANAVHREHVERVLGRGSVAEMCYLDIKTFLPSLNLTYTDKMSMAHGVEVRLPFLDHELVEAALRIPDGLKIRRWTPKYILKRAMAGVLPDEIVWRHKAGFTAPIRGWLHRDLAPLVDDWLSPERIRHRGLFRPDAVQRMVNEHRSGLEDNAWKIWQLITLEMWTQTFLDSDGSTPVAIDAPVKRGIKVRRSERCSSSPDPRIPGSLDPSTPRPGSPPAVSSAFSRRRLWERTPHMLKRVARPLVELVPPVWLYGRRFRELFAQVQQIDRWSSERARAHQLERVRDICRLAETTPHYARLFRSVGFDWRDLKDLDDLSALPTMNRTTIEENLADMCTMSPDTRGVEFVSTGGTTGAPLRFYIGADRSAVEFAYLVASWQRVGYRLEIPQAVLRGMVIKGNGNGLLHDYDPLLRRHHYSNFHMTDENMARYIAHIRAIGPCFLHVYPSSVSALARFLERSGTPPPGNVLGILAGSENVYADDRDRAQRVFGVRYFSWYGHSEKVIMAAECEHSVDYHVWPTYGYFELLDEKDRPVDTPGQRGEIVGTGFINRVVPFIRYRTGDFATFVGDHCPKCGRQQPVIRDIRGHRTQEMLVAGDGSLISWTAVNMHDDTFDRVSRFQFVQQVPGRATLFVVPAPGFSQVDEERIQRQLSGKLHDRIAFDIKKTEEIRLTQSGKSTFVDQRIDLTKYLEAGEARSHEGGKAVS